MASFTGGGAGPDGTGPVLAVVYGTRGGMSDVGKFVALHALRQRGEGKLAAVRLVAMSLESEEGGHDDKGFACDITDLALQRQVAKTLEAEAGAIAKVDAADPATATDALVAQFIGADAVVVCVGNRQPKMSRWVAPATRQITDAMATAGVTRLVQLSSMGIGDDRLQLDFIKALWWTMLRTMLRSARQDLTAAEQIVQASSCDYLLVRPMGLTPSEPPRGAWALLRADGDRGRLGVSVAKSDVAAFMLQEALEPSLSRTAVTIGPAPQAEASGEVGAAVPTTAAQPTATDGAAAGN